MAKRPSKPTSKPTPKPSSHAGPVNDDDMWQKVAHSVRPLSPLKRARIIGSAPVPKAGSPELSGSPESAGRNGPADEHPSQRSTQHSPQRPLQRKGPTTGPLGKLDYREIRKVHRGRAAIDAQLDLHGFTQAQAQRRLQQFVQQAWARGDRWLLVVTGKGMAGQGVLRASLPDWVRQPILRDYVLGIEAAHSSHGGDGAYYLRLRGHG